MEYLVMSVQEAEVSILKSNPPQLGVFAKGTVNSGGWSQGKLVPYTYVTEPEDGIQDFSFVARGPTGIVTMALVPNFPGSGGIHSASWIKGVRIHAATNSIEVMLDSFTNESNNKEFLNAPSGDDPWPFPWSSNPGA